MAPIVSKIEIDRPPDQVFAYVTDAENIPKWQASAHATRIEREDPASGVTRAVINRQMGPRAVDHTIEVKMDDPPRSWTVRGVDGPIRPVVNGQVEPLDDGARSRVTVELDPKGHGIGLLFSPLARRQMVREMPGNMQRLKGLIEG